MDKEKKKILFYGTIGLLLIIVVVLGATYAFFSSGITNQNKNLVTTGTLSISYTEGNVISANNLKTATAQQVLAAYNANTCIHTTDTTNSITTEQICYANTFTITNTGTLAAVVNTTLSNVTNTYSDNLLYQVFTTTPETLTGSILGTNTVLTGIGSDTYIPALTNNTKTYTLLIWLSESATNIDQNKSYTAKISSTATQTNTEYVELDGVLYDSNNQILANTNLELHSTVKTTTTDSDGYFNFGYVEVGTHTIKATDNNETTLINDTFTIQKGTNSVTNKIVSATNSIKLKVKQKVDTTIEISEYQEEVSMLPDGMIPIMYYNNTWVKADATNTNNTYKWYDYDNKQWANAVMVNSTIRDTYMNASVGTEITEESILAYYVWIPRYKYKLFNVEFASVSSQSIDVVFENTTDTISDGTCNGTYTVPTNNCYYSHPAFWWDNNSNGVREEEEELSGIWVGKFETTGDTTTPTVKPGITSLREQIVSTQFTTSQKLGTSTYLTTTGTSTTDAHMLKNMEWGAVAYLKQSIYGLNTTDITINNNSTTFYTGGGSETTYKSSLGQSTTGNIYGIYDMSGNAYEYVMGVMEDNTNTNTPMSGHSTTYNSGYTGKAYDGTTWTNITGVGFSNTKYYDIYKYGTTNNDQAAYNRSKLGDATGETRGWYNDYPGFLLSSYPWFLRGGYYNDGDSAGVFDFGRGVGNASSYDGFRSSLVHVGEPA